MSRGKKINVVEAFAISLATMAPTGSMAGNTGPGAKFAGVNLPIAFLIAAVAMLVVAVGFCEMSKHIAADGSIYAYNRVALGEHWGFVSGWIVTLAYMCSGVGMGALSGTYLSLLLKNLGLKVSPVLLGFVVLALVWFVLGNGIKLTSNVSLVTETVALAILLLLGVLIVTHGGPNGTNVQPFVPQTSFSGLGQGVVYTALCFAGFEVSCAVATRTKNPKKSIPRALLLTILGGAVIFVFVSYAVVIGFGTSHGGVTALMTSKSPLDFLAVKYMGPEAAVVIDFAIFLSTLGATITTSNTAIYVIYALGEKKYLSSKLGVFNYHHDTPKNAVNFMLALEVVLYAVVVFATNVNKVYLYFMTLCALCLIVIYMLSCVGSFVLFKKHKRDYHRSFWKHEVAPVVGFVALLFPLASNVFPVPAFPMNVMPYFILFWGVLGYGMSVHHTKKLAAAKQS